jgi:uncharacterized membrane protein (UPF0127 family)
VPPSRRCAARSFALALLIAAALLASACTGSGHVTASATPAATSTATVEPVAFATSTLSYPGGVLQIEVASTDAQGQRGLGYRDALAPAAGMIFDLHETRVPVFWMKGMRFALDMVWIGDDRRVAGVTAGVQPEPGIGDDRLRRYSPDIPVRYVLELNAGAAARLSLTAGTQFAFELPAPP